MAYFVQEYRPGRLPSCDLSRGPVRLRPHRVPPCVDSTDPHRPGQAEVRGPTPIRRRPDYPRGESVRGSARGLIPKSIGRRMVAPSSLLHFLSRTAREGR